MDDNLEQPNAEPKVRLGDEIDEEDQSSGDEDDGPDWTKLMYRKLLLLSLSR